MDEVEARTLPERRQAALERLRSGGNLWLASASDGRGPAPDPGVVLVGRRTVDHGDVRKQPDPEEHPSPAAGPGLHWQHE